MTVLFLYEEYFKFKPTFKIFMTTNHKPVIKGTDHSIWRRIKSIPFTTTIQEEKQDKSFGVKLKQEASGILNLKVERVWVDMVRFAPYGTFDYEKCNTLPRARIAQASHTRMCAFAPLRQIKDFICATPC